MWGFEDITFCTDRKCLRTVCFRHPKGLERNVDNWPVAMSDFTNCPERIHAKGDGNDKD